ncbi:hypothetical protein GCM10016234_34590 [Tianweitania populi]|uniref:Uncharacterized protein n=1 Tax=Tianweitania populi TaxID=1607949 RepID=A0A8J3E066_9HYPH|nr:hypothetical protein GCM10016234_34590 [Tianweitania populi]
MVPVVPAQGLMVAFIGTQADRYLVVWEAMGDILTLLAAQVALEVLRFRPQAAQTLRLPPAA